MRLGGATTRRRLGSVAPAKPLIPVAAGGKPLIGHALNFKPDQLLSHMEACAVESASWSYYLDVFGKRSMVVGDPDLAMALLRPGSGWSSRGLRGSKFLRDAASTLVGDGESLGVVFADSARHHGIARGAAEAGLSRPSFVRASTETILEKTAKLNRVLAESGGSTVDVAHWYGKAALDVVGALAFSRDLKALDGDSAPSPLEAIFSKNIRGLAELINSPLAYWRYAPPFLETAFDRYVEGGREALRLVEPIVRERRDVAKAAGEGFEPKCFVDVLLKAGDAATPPLSDAEVVRNSGQILAAGYDTTSNTLSFASLLLAARPKLQDALRAELLAAAPAADGPLAPEHFPKTPLLTSVIKETLRAAPARPLPLSFLFFKKTR